MSRRSRLSRRLEKKTKRSLFLSIAGIIVVLFLLVKYGIPLLSNFALLLANNKPIESTSSRTSTYITVPQINPLPVATNSAKLKLSGQSKPADTIDLYINDIITDKTQTDKNGNFSFDALLTKGDNNIYVKGREGKDVSSPSTSFNVIFKDTLPTLTLNAPSDGQQFSKDQNPANINGKTDANVKITVNGFWAIVDQDNNFSYQLPLQNGDNPIKVVATDIAGNKTEKDITVKYSP